MKTLREHGVSSDFETWRSLPDRSVAGGGGKLCSRPGQLSPKCTKFNILNKKKFCAPNKF